MKSIYLLFTVLFLNVSVFASTSIVNLRTEYSETPIGLDEMQPRFSWQMASDHIGAAQNAYRILVAAGENKLNAGEYVFDTGKTASGLSVGIRYLGDVLRPATRYFWKVQVWDENGAMVESEPSWFETGLMGAGWSRAEWIGSSEVLLSKYRTFFLIDFDLEIPEGSNRAVFVYSAKDAGNYISVEINLNGANKTQFIIRHMVEGVEQEDFVEDISHIITAANKNAPHHVRLKVTTPGYHLMSFLNPEIDGIRINYTSPDAAQGRMQTQALTQSQARTQMATTGKFTINPYPNGERVHDYARLHSIGFRQPGGERAVFSNITLSEDNWNTTLYVDPVQKHDVTGTDKLEVWEPYGHTSAPMLRKTVMLDKPVRSARLYVTARGVYEFYINDKRVGNDYFNPGCTDYRYRIMYNTYDITSMLRQGDNGLGAMLGSGWFSDLNLFTASFVDAYGIRQSLMAKIIVFFEDGTSQTIVTDGTWKCYDTGPVTRNGFQFGEDYDARKEQDGWTTGSFDDSKWKPATIFERPAANVIIQAYVGLPICNHITLTAQSVTEPIKGTYVYDLGKNIVGVPRLEGMKGKSGQTINIRYGEMIYPDIIPTKPVEPYTIEIYQKMKGQVYIENYRGAVSIDNYILRGQATGETYQPLFTCHGFRYISVTGLDAPLPVEQVKGIVLESIGNATSSYVSSDKNVNLLFENIQWGQRGNFLSVPTDCPQRDERAGWTGDAQVFARAATYFSPEVDQFYTRWLYTMRDNQNRDGSYSNYYPTMGQPPYGASNEGQAGSMGWMEAGIIVPWQVYQQFGDVGILEQHYSSMKRYMGFLELRAEDNIQPPGGLGDHLAIIPTNNSLTHTAYYAYDAMIMSRIAGQLGKKADEERYSRLYQDIKTRFNEKFVNEQGVTQAPYVPMMRRETPVAPDPAAGEIRPVDTQTSYVVPLQADLFSEKNKPLALRYLVENIAKNNNTLTTGFIGTPYLNPVLSENGRDDVAYTLFEQTLYPSWLYPVLQGATTMWERWNSYTIENGFGPVDMNSFNHYAYGAIGEWMFAYSLGIQRDEKRPGYKHIVLQPKVGGEMTFANGYFESPYGIISSGWEKTAAGYIYRVTIPANTTASLNLAASGIDRVSVLKGKDGVGPFRSLTGKVMVELKSGTYEFEIKK
ncbi:MAG: glycoside hydrolase family 78 protein [Tannerella sp.]|jgi:alpha-L-rhamnosidase|nr:glycoside hydrolase family 78 protein [Tannerella sp.]